MIEIITEYSSGDVLFHCGDLLEYESYQHDSEVGVTEFILKGAKESKEELTLPHYVYRFVPVEEKKEREIYGNS